jgi:hypothetical protein
MSEEGNHLIVMSFKNLDSLKTLFDFSPDPTADVLAREVYHIKSVRVEDIEADFIPNWLEVYAMS